jgi:hypothetical protein
MDALATQGLSSKDKKVRNRTQAMGTKKRLYDRSLFKMVPKKDDAKVGEYAGNEAFQTSSQAVYVVHKTGAFVCMSKDRRSPKERKAARRAEREKATA